MKNLVLISLFHVLLITKEITSHPANVINSSSRNSEPEDSPLERVRVKQETGFDGKVRSIRFSLEPENKDEKQSSQRDYPVTTSSRIEAKLTSEVSDSTTTSSRLIRSIDKLSTKNTIGDLQAEEAKVFRPLFAYRQQVARRLNWKNDKKSSYARPVIQRTMRFPYDYKSYQRLPYVYTRYRA